MRQEIIEKLKELQDLKYRDFNKPLIPNVAEDKIIGVRLPVLRKIAREIVKTDGLSYFCEIVNTQVEELYYEEKMLAEDKIIGVRLPVLRKIAREIVKTDGLSYFCEIVNTQVEELYYEEKMLAGMTIGYAKLDIKQWCNLMDRYVPFIDNWAVCDSVCASMKTIVNNHQKEIWDYMQKYLEDNREFHIRFGVVMAMDYFVNDKYIASMKTIVNNHQKEIWDYMQKYLEDNREFHIRFGVVMAMDYFVNDKYIDKFLEKLKTVKTTDYYAMMAVAWAISVVFVKYEEKAMELIKSNSLDIVTHNKVIQKIRESNRVEKEKKILITKFKRKV